MDFYRFAVTHFHIRDTRARHEDTLHLGHAIYADGDKIASSVVSLGDFNNGPYDTQNYVSPGPPGLHGIVINDPYVKVAFVFQLVNAGNVPAGALDGRMAASADQLAGIAAGLQGEGAVSLGAGAVPVALALEAFANIWSWLTVDCDGPVAVDQTSGPRYLIDAWADDDPTGTIVTDRRYPGSESPHGCGSNSDYDVTWIIQHSRGWAGIADATGSRFRSATGVTAATHNGAVHAFGVIPGTAISHARTFTGVNWFVGRVDPPTLVNLPVSAVSFNDRLYVVGVKADGSIWPLAFTTDGGSWRAPTRNPAGLQTAEPIATTVFRNRLYTFARDSAANSLQVTSTADLLSWNPWVKVPATGMPPTSPVAAAALSDTLHIFGIYHTGKPPETAVVVCNSTADGHTWTGWQQVEAGARPEGLPATDIPLDVAATTFQDRVYITTRWESTDAATGETSHYIAVNFTSDGNNWSGWRLPASTTPYQPAATAGLAAVNNHLYIVTPEINPDANDNTLVSAH